MVIRSLANKISKTFVLELLDPELNQIAAYYGAPTSTITGLEWRTGVVDWTSSLLFGGCTADFS